MDKLILNREDLEEMVYQLNRILGMHISSDYEAQALCEKLEDFLDNNHGTVFTLTNTP